MGINNAAPICRVGGIEPWLHAYPIVLVEINPGISKNQAIQFLLAGPISGSIRLQQILLTLDLMALNADPTPPVMGKLL